MSHVEDQANYYKNLHLRNRSIQAVVHIENKDDERFWNVQLQTIRPGHYHFVSQSRNEAGVESKGCEQCLKYLHFTNPHFFICIDSDFRLLRGDDDLTPNNYIAQTYTYSWESHLCEAEHLQQRFYNKTDEVDFDFVAFLKNLSTIVYKPLIYLIHYQDPDLNNFWNLKKFNQCIPLQPSREDLKDNGTKYLKKIEQLFKEKLSSLSLPDNIDVKNLTPENAYLHIQGHRLYDLITHIGTRLCKGKRIAFKSDILDASYPICGYEEIDRVQYDLRSILDGQNDKTTFPAIS